MRTCCTFILLILAVAGQAPKAVAADPPKKAYLVFPIRTQLQREYFFEPHERYHLMVHGESLLDGEGKLDPARLDLDKLSREVGYGQHGKPKETISVSVIYAKEPPEASAQMLEFALLGWATGLGYERYPRGRNIGDDDWKKALELTKDARGLYEEKKEEKEDAVGDESVRVFPVHTVFSRVMSGDADCLVVFPKPYGKDATGTLDDAAKAEIKKLVDSLKLPQRKKVSFGISTKLTDTPDKKAVDKFLDETSKELAKELGFENRSVRHHYVK